MARDRPVPRASSSKDDSNTSTSRHTFTRSERALCRFLAQEHKVPVFYIHVTMGWAVNSIYNVLRGRGPASRDNVDEDKKHLPPDADAILGKIRKRMSDEPYTKEMPPPTRALCRFLAAERVSVAEIHLATEWSAQSIYNVLRGKHSYANINADDDKKYLPPDADAILLKIRTRKAERSNAKKLEENTERPPADIRKRIPDLQEDAKHLTASERALFHFLAHEHSVPVAEVHTETGWSVVTIQNVLKGKGSYTKINPDDHKKHLPPDADAILLKIRTRMADTLHVKTMPPPTRALCRFLAGEHVAVADIHHATGWSVTAVHNMLRGKGRYANIIADDDKKHLPPDAGAILLQLRTRKAERSNAKSGGNIQSLPVDEIPSVEATKEDSPPDDFLLHFMTGLFMDQNWYRVFKKAGIDETAMKEFGRQKGDLRAFLDKRCSTMSDFDRFILEAAAQNLVSFFDH
ncbi:hypothetical protein C8R43DRAFT_1155773 [Mycena crocata]|nr:hypothetical protein C8R43DRAFT_1155773 [Mycena crocata]